MNGRTGAALIGFAMALPACQSPPSTGVAQNVEFLRGCWIDRSGPGSVATLRLLPPTPDAATLDGEILVYPTTRKPYELEDRISLSFARDGSRMHRSSATDPQSRFNPGEFVVQPGTRQTGDQTRKRIRWLNAKDKVISYVAEADGENLTLSIVIPSGHEWNIREVEFEGRRDGCD